MDHARALRLLELEDAGEEEVIRKQFRRLALRMHPDRHALDDRAEKAARTAAFVELQSALEVALACVLCTKSDVEVQGIVDDEVEEVLRAYPPTFVAQFRHLLGEMSKGGKAQPLSEVLDKHFFGTQFRSDEVDFRIFQPAPTAERRDMQLVYRCKECPDPASSVCARLSKPTKNKCVCGHNAAAHAPGGKKCSKCACTCFAYHIQQQAWEARCGCKHKHTDHHVTGARKCRKDIPGKRGTPCPCNGYMPSWVCHCGHPASSHETVVCYIDLKERSIDRALLGREWVAGGLRVETVALAEDSREKMAQYAVRAVAVNHGDLGRAQTSIAAHAQRRGASYVAQAKMYEAAAAAAKPAQEQVSSGPGARAPRGVRAAPGGRVSQRQQ
eukprot:TRINITY_DN2114_c0_g1_i1.p2 TRINITY_DN2114_c0_g1~~TRINITY_DN2114_c0_g1_i1.p2  ORF type:complete len:385 (+),score=72.42 TRINITY_DN2114_c0_g1_i1:89-1243(+)